MHSSKYRSKQRRVAQEVAAQEIVTLLNSPATHATPRTGRQRASPFRLFPTPNLASPSVNLTSPSVNLTSPSVNLTSPSVNLTTPQSHTKKSGLRVDVTGAIVDAGGRDIRPLNPVSSEYAVVTVPGDGDCFYASIYTGINALLYKCVVRDRVVTKYQVRTLRDKVARYIEKYPFVAYTSLPQMWMKYKGSRNMPPGLIESVFAQNERTRLDDSALVPALDARDRRDLTDRLLRDIRTMTEFAEDPVFQATADVLKVDILVYNASGSRQMREFRPRTVTDAGMKPVDAVATLRVAQHHNKVSSKNEGGGEHFNAIIPKRYVGQCAPDVIDARVVPKVWPEYAPSIRGYYAFGVSLYGAGDEELGTVDNARKGLGSVDHDITCKKLLKHPERFVFRRVRGDGSCMFHAVLYALRGVHPQLTESFELRQKVVDWVVDKLPKKNKDLWYFVGGEDNYKKYIEKGANGRTMKFNLTEYARSMRRPDTFGGSMELVGLAAVLGIRIVSTQEGGGPAYFGRSGRCVVVVRDPGVPGMASTTAHFDALLDTRVHAVGSHEPRHRHFATGIELKFGANAEVVSLLDSPPPKKARRSTGGGA